MTETKEREEEVIVFENDFEEKDNPTKEKLNPDKFSDDPNVWFDLIGAIFGVARDDWEKYCKKLKENFGSEEDFNSNYKTIVDMLEDRKNFFLKSPEVIMSTDKMKSLDKTIKDLEKIINDCNDKIDYHRNIDYELQKVKILKNQLKRLDKNDADPEKRKELLDKLEKAENSEKRLSKLSISKRNEFIEDRKKKIIKNTEDLRKIRKFKKDVTEKLRLCKDEFKLHSKIVKNANIALDNDEVAKMFAEDLKPYSDIHGKLTSIENFLKQEGANYASFCGLDPAAIIDGFKKIRREILSQ